MSNATETRMQRKLLAAYINAEPADIVLMRPVKTTTAAGGVVHGEPVPVLVNDEPQRFRLVPFKRRLTDVTSNTPDGDIHNLKYVLIGRHDADVKKDDFFDYDGNRFEVVSKEPKDEYRQAWNITYRGPTDAV